MKTLYTIFLAAILPLSSMAQCTDPPGQPGPITGTDPACTGSTFEYHIAPVPDATSYIWTIPNGWSGSSTTTSLNVLVGTDPGAISVAAVNDCGISAAQVYNATMFYAAVTPSGPVTICSDNAPVILTANSGVGYTYQWFEGSSQIPGATDITYDATVSGSYYVQVASNNCMGQSAPVNVSVTEMPVITATSNSPGCAGMQLDFSGTSTTSGVTYNWTGPNNFSNAQNPSIANASPSDAGIYTLTVTKGPCVTSATTPVVIYQSAPVTPSPITGPLELCAYQSGNAYEVTDDPNAAQYNWTIPNSWSGSSIINNIQTGVGLAGNFTITVTAENGCGVSAPVSLNVTVHPLPEPTIVQSGNTLTVSQPFATYQWYNGITTVIPGATGQSYTPIQSGNYSVVVTSDEGCIGQSILATFTTAVNTVNNERSINLYPNPNTSSFTIEGVVASNDNKINVTIIDIAGRIVHQQQVSVVNNKIAARIDLNSSIVPGIYTLKISSDTTNIVIPFVRN